MNTQDKFTGRTKVVDGVTYREYVDTDIMGRTSLQWMNDAIANMTTEEAIAIHSQLVADEQAAQAAEEAAEASTDADGVRMTAELIALREGGNATTDAIKAVLGKYVDMPAEDAPFDLSDLVLAVQEGFGVELKLAKLSA